MRLAEFPKLSRVERGCAFYPWVQRICCNAVECFFRRGEIMSSVVDVDFNLRIVDHAKVVFSEIFRRDFHSQRLYLGDHDALCGGVDADRAGGDARAEADY